VGEKGFVNFRQALQDGGVGGKVSRILTKARMMNRLILTAIGY